jgi:hypothetical protein
MSSGYAAWFEEMLEELGCEIWVGHAADIRNSRGAGRRTIGATRSRFWSC